MMSRDYIYVEDRKVIRFVLDERHSIECSIVNGELRIRSDGALKVLPVSSNGINVSEEG
jgi:hypothetical protein